MRLFAEKWWKRVGWGAPTSVALHLIVVFLLLFDLPLELPKPPKEQTVNVELVPPPEAKEEKKAEQKKAGPKKGEEKKAEQPKPQAKPKPQPKPEPKSKPEPRPAQQLPQSFASAMAKTKQDNKEAELPPAARDTVKKTETSEPAKAVDDKAKPADEPPKVPPAEKKEPVKEPKPLSALAVPAKSSENATQKADEKAASTVAEAKPEPKETPQAKPQEVKSEQETAKAKPADAAAKVELKPVPSKMTEAKELYSAKSIADPRVKQALINLPVKRRILQLCNLEALEQIRSQRPDTPPEGLVPFGPKGGFISKNRMDASGGAYQSKANWYDVDFKCVVNEEATEVTSFSIAIGDAVPKTSWRERRLPGN
ncbi:MULTISPECIES: DUF930 domain-containing protein [Sinorhizobium/Ensifer group]|uniref:DUF930 domain-containing protein n=1 Tax=Sinorhizobium/Ensifer group TaxID=227292 RepID=UPI0007C79616|nr:MULTISPECIES: DUF930 domain-containing protein [Sinorhizobium/Ensifer group]MBD9511707.1 DUF930 domain-containing protein [Ensifer sp. ENS10]MBV7518074.1 DUF930 domain-containing protein [Ensifer sp. ENS12]